MQEYQPLDVDGTTYATRYTPKYRRRAAIPARSPREVRALIPGVVWEVHVSPGDRVERGALLLTLEAMKMLNPVAAARSGVVARVHVAAGARVAKGQLLVDFS